MEEAAQVDRETAQEIVGELNKAGHSVGIEDVVPAGDIVHGIGEAVSSATVGSPGVRDAPSRNFLGEVFGRLEKMRGPDDIVVVK